MKNLLESLSLGSGAAIVAVASVLLASIWHWVAKGKATWLVALLLPFLLSFSLYWSPVWLGANPSEYSSWELLFVGAWFLAGAVPSVLMVLIFRRHRANGDGQRTRASSAR